jgi:hypothetical protein
MKISGIYKIQSKCKPERCYIGSAVNIDQRWSRHIYTLKSGKHKNIKLQRHFNKYGIGDLTFSILLGCERDYLIANEQFFIDSYKPYFNINPNAGNCLGHFPSEVTKKKISNSLKGNIPAMKGKKFPEEFKQKLRKAWERRRLTPFSEETRSKMSKAMSGANNPFYGRKHSAETRRKIGNSRTGKYTKENNNFYGKHHSEESRRKMSESIKKALKSKKQNKAA